MGKRLHGDPCLNFCQVDTEGTFTGSRTHVVRRALLFAAQLALNLRLRGVAYRAYVRHTTRMARGLVIAHGRQLLDEPKVEYRFSLRRPTFHTSPHVRHRQYVSVVTTVLVVVRSDERQAGQADGAVTGSRAWLRLALN
jgi:hypothetical protein